MAQASSQPATIALLEVERNVSGAATCPLCHTTHPQVVDATLGASGDWQCERCGQHWTAKRLATVAAYDAWAREPENTRQTRTP